jgi:type IV pilus biogenesis protein CpaD/CtpE
MRAEHVHNMVEVRAAPLWQALETLEQTPEVHEVALFGDALHAELAPEIADPAALVRARLEAAGVTVERAGKVPPTMEDVFVSLARRVARPTEVGADR